MRSQDKRFSRKALASFSITAVLAVTAAGAQVAGAPAGAAIDATGLYQSEVQACMQGRTGSEDHATCLKEARNAQADKKRGVLESGSNYQANARARCAALSGEDQAAALPHHPTPLMVAAALGVVDLGCGVESALAR